MQAKSLVEIPAGWTEEESAGATLVHLSAYRALTMWETLKPNSVVLVTGDQEGLASPRAAGGRDVVTQYLISSIGTERRLKELAHQFIGSLPRTRVAG